MRKQQAKVGLEITFIRTYLLRKLVKIFEIARNRLFSVICKSYFQPLRTSIVRCSTFVYFCVQYKNYLRQDFSWFTAKNFILKSFRRNCKNQKQLWCITKFGRSHFLYKKPVYKKNGSNTNLCLNNHFTTP